MLGEGFLRVLRYKEERRLTSTTNRQSTQNHPGDTTGGALPNSVKDTLSVEAGCSPILIRHPQMSSDFETSCSLLAQYPDLRLGQETDDRLEEPSGTLRSTYRSSYRNIPGVAQHAPEVEDHGTRREIQGDLSSSMSDQGYLVMGTSLTNSLDVPGSRLGPMSNSLLNGLLDKQLDEVYLQHLTDSLARCNSQNSLLLQGLVPPPQRNIAAQGLEDSLEAGLGREGQAVDHGKAIGYLSTLTGPPCSSNFSSPVLRISEAENARHGQSISGGPQPKTLRTPAL